MIDGVGPVEILVIAVFSLAVVAVVGGFVLAGYSALRSARAARRAGLDPFTSEAQLVAEALRGREQPLEQRLAELDDLHRRGVISAEEHRQARVSALGG